MLEYVKFGVCAALLLGALFMELSAVRGVFRFRYSVTRLHAAGLGDTLGMLCLLLAAVVYVGWDVLSLKLALIAALMWITGPVSTHLLSHLEWRTDETFGKKARTWKS